VTREYPGVEQLDDTARAVKLDHEVEVVVFACLMPKQRINTPAAVQPDIDSLGL